MSNKLGKENIIRLATFKDIDDIKEYRTQVSQETSYMNNPSKEKIKETLEKYIKNKNMNYYLIYKKDKIVAMFIYRIDERKKVFHIDHISVCKEMYGTGLAQQLMEFGEEQAAKNKITKLELIVHEDNTRGRKFYEKIGYQHTRSVKHVLTYEKEINVKKPSLENW